MKRVTIAMNEDLYKSLLEYAADQSKINVRRLSIGEAVRNLVALQLENVGYGVSREVPTPSRGRSEDQSIYLRRGRT